MQETEYFDTFILYNIIRRNYYVKYFVMKRVDTHSNLRFLWSLTYRTLLYLRVRYHALSLRRDLSRKTMAQVIPRVLYSSKCDRDKYQTMSKQSFFWRLSIRI